MPHRPALTSSRSRLFHAALAHISPQVQTLDAIIQTPIYVVAAFHQQSSFLPVELLLIIRSYLHAVITNQLLQQSAEALKNYEASVRQLLCADCLAWNQDIYGADIWQWEQFSGGCACQDIGAGLQGRFRYPSRRKNGLIPNPKQFVDSSHWLEFYLSCTLRRASGHNDFPIHSYGSSPVWSTVSDVLRLYGCEVLRDGAVDSPLVPDSPISRVVHVVPLSSEVARYERERVSSAGGTADYWSQIILHRVSRDLSLGLDDKDTELLVAPSIPKYSTGITKGSVSMDWPHAVVSQLLMGTLHIVATIIGTCLSLPLTFATVAVTILCFYSRPKCMRIV